MSQKSNTKKEDDWWLDRWLMKLLSPLLKLFSSSKEKPPKVPKPAKPPKVVKVLYGSSEPCYCGSEKKYKHCCKKENKKIGKVAIKVIRRTRKGEKIKVKVVEPVKDFRLFKEPLMDSGIDATLFDSDV